jgi:hypothetical protein
MPQPSLDCPCVAPLIGKDVAAGVAEHVRVSFQIWAETTASRPLDHPAKPAVLNGAPRSLTNTNGDGLLSRCSRRSARSSSPCKG